jgi:ATP-binding protein involved in chromosome partitioning
MSAPSPSEAAVLECLQGVTDPELGRSLAELKMLKSATVSDANAVAVEVVLPTPAYPKRERIATAIQSALAQRFPDAPAAEVSFSHEVKGKNPGGAIGQSVKNILAVGSGKGGVGKSTIAAALAYGLKSYGAQVGLMDADVYGPSIPHLVGASGQPGMIERQDANGQLVQRIVPIDADGMKLMSMGFMIGKEQAVIWRGPMLHKALTQFLQQTEWGELDYLVIDLPPGTGDVSLTLSQLVGLAGAVIVCTPQQVALLDAIKAISMFRQVNIPVLGMVENMSGEIFGRGGAKKQAELSGVPFLGEVPSEADIRIKGDEGRMAQLFDEGSPAREPLLHVCEQIALQVVKQHLDAPSLPSLEIL